MDNAIPKTPNIVKGKLEKKKPHRMQSPIS